jgi:hypothetical protein
MLLPFIPLHAVYSALDLKKRNSKFNIFMTAVYASLHSLWIALFACGKMIWHLPGPCSSSMHAS